MSENINEEDLGFLDLLLYNLLANIVSFPELFGSKEEIVKFSERVAAEKVLGIRSSVRPKKFSYLDIRWK
jgi:hypothetical protein